MYVGLCIYYVILPNFTQIRFDFGFFEEGCRTTTTTTTTTTRLVPEQKSTTTHRQERQQEKFRHKAGFTKIKVSALYGCGGATRAD